MTLATLLSLACFGRAEAAFVTYTETVTASGFLGNQGFVNALVTITGTSDTDNVFLSNLGNYSNITSTTVTIANIGSATFTDIIEITNSQSFITFVDLSFVPRGASILGIENPVFLPYDLKSSIGPLSGFLSFQGVTQYSTTAGSFLIYSASNASNPEFSATVSSGSVPEPASLAMVGLGVALAATRACLKSQLIPITRR